MMKFLSRDKNIVQFYGACIIKGHLSLCCEYMEVRHLLPYILPLPQTFCTPAIRKQYVCLACADCFWCAHLSQVRHNSNSYCCVGD